MNDEDYIRKAVDLADGWFDNWDRPFCDAITKDNTALCLCYDNMEQFMLDALAAQLVRQVDALGLWLDSRNEITEISKRTYSGRWEVIAFHEEDGRTMNTLKAIIDSGVLDA